MLVRRWRFGHAVSIVMSRKPPSRAEEIDAITHLEDAEEANDACDAADEEVCAHECAEHATGIKLPAEALPFALF